MSKNDHLSDYNKSTRNSLRKRLANKIVNSNMRTSIKSFLLFLKSKESSNQTLLIEKFQLVQSKIHKAATKNVIKSTTASRKVSRLHKKVKSLLSK